MFVLSVLVGGYFARLLGKTTDLEILNPLWDLINLIPDFAVAMRRLHDTDRTGWWIATLPGAFLLMLPYLLLSPGGQPDEAASPLQWIMMTAGLASTSILFLIVLLFLCQRGTPGPNRFGGRPSTPEVAETFS